MNNSDAVTIRDAIATIYAAFPNLSYRPRPDDVRLLAAFMKSQDSAYPKSLDILLEGCNRVIEIELSKYKR